MVGSGRFRPYILVGTAHEVLELRAVLLETDYAQRARPHIVKVLLDFPDGDASRALALQDAGTARQKLLARVAGQRLDRGIAVHRSAPRVIARRDLVHDDRLGQLVHDVLELLQPGAGLRGADRERHGQLTHKLVRVRRRRLLPSLHLPRLAKLLRACLSFAARLQSGGFNPREERLPEPRL
eukprot:559365-Prymnesium_polylepis.2